MPSFEIENYSLAQFNRSASTNGTRAVIRFYDATDNLVIYAQFWKGDTLLPNRLHNGVYYLYFAWDEYLPMVDMLRNEKPIYGAIADSLTWGYITTRREPIGEAEIDELTRVID